MDREEDQASRRWLGGEAQVRPHNGRSRRVSLRQLFSESLLLLAGMGLGGLGTAGVIQREDRKRSSSTGECGKSVSKERSGAMGEEQTNQRPGRDGGVDAMGVGSVLAAFGLGLLAGAVVALLTTPESGAGVRTRLKRGMETAKSELDDVVGGAKEDWNTVGSDVREAVKRTASRVKEATEITKEALISGDADARRTS